MKTLYVTDLDGTLMRNDKTISEKTIDICNHFISENVRITYATARSIHTAAEITRKINFKLPVITRNGTVLADHSTKKMIAVNTFSCDEIQSLRRHMKGKSLYGLVTAELEGRERTSYIEKKKNESFRHYLMEHRGDARLRPVQSEEALFDGEVNYFTFMDEYKNLLPFYNSVKDSGKWVCYFQKDTYGSEYWLEICPKKATKANMILALKEQFQCDRVVVFGDSLNDISMFEIADEAYAVANGMDELKELATAVIESNEDDGVARFLQKDCADERKKG